ncbi:MAG: hypothetical protein ACOC1G_02825 [Phycisphaeraceae bacterium]
MHHTEGLQPPDPQLAARWRRSMRHSPASFTGEAQRAVIEALQTACGHIHANLHAIASDATHFHVLVSWIDEEIAWERVRTSIKRSITLCLKQMETRPWLTKRASRKRVTDRQHFDYLVSVYLPRHRGWKWTAKKGLHR